MTHLNAIKNNLVKLQKLFNKDITKILGNDNVFTDSGFPSDLWDIEYEEEFERLGFTYIGHGRSRVAFTFKHNKNKYCVKINRCRKNSLACGNDEEINNYKILCKIFTKKVVENLVVSPIEHFTLNRKTVLVTEFMKEYTGKYVNKINEQRINLIQYLTEDYHHLNVVVDKQGLVRLCDIDWLYDNCDSVNITDFGKEYKEHTKALADKSNYALT